MEGGEKVPEMFHYWNDICIPDNKLVDYVIDKKKSAKSYIRYMLIRLQKMFSYKNLPDTIPREMLELYLMQGGICFVTKVNDKLYAFQGTVGGEPDPYYRPTLFIVANPALKFNKSLDLWNDGVLMRNDSMWYGLMPLLSRYASMMAENLVTLRSADVMLRVVALLTAPNDATKIAAEEYLRKLEKGQFAVIGENRFLDGIKMQSPPSNNGSYLTQFIELHQYLKASFYNELGLESNYNMKREAIGRNESAMDRDTLVPLCEEMLRCRREDVSRLNEMYGTDISVDFDSAWLQNVEENQLELDKMRADAISQLKGGQDEAAANNQANDQGNSADNGVGSADSSGVNDSDADGSTSSSVRNDGEFEGTNSDSTQSDVSGSGKDGESAVRDEGGNAEADTNDTENVINIEINVSQLNQEGGEDSGREDDRGYGEGSEPRDEDS